jgi:hypothetical protein
MDQLLERGMVTAPRDTETPITPARRAASMTIQRIHLLKVQRTMGKLQAPSTKFQIKG